MKRAILILGLFFLTNVIVGQNIVDKKWGFKIDVPSSWSQKNYMDGTDKVYDFYSADKNAAFSLRIFDITSNLTYDILIPLYEKNIFPAASRVLLKDLVSKNGIPGKQAIYAMNHNGNKIDIAVFYTFQNMKAYILAAMVVSELAENYKNDILQTTSSFTIEGFEKNVNLVQEKKKPVGLRGVLRRSIENNSQSVGNTSKGNSFESNQGTNKGSSFVYEGQTYRTVKIGSQVWMAENLSVGKMVIADKYKAMQKDNNIIEYYAPKNDDQQAKKIGAFYTWDEMMQYAPSDNAQVGSTQGICPSGWHLPTDYEWNVLEAFVDSEFDLNSTNWFNTANRGTDSGKKLKSRNGWKVTRWVSNPNGTDDYGFNILPSGGPTKGIFFLIPYGLKAAYWTATAQERNDAMAWKRTFENRFDNVNRTNNNKREALLVRCIKNE